MTQESGHRPSSQDSTMTAQRYSKLREIFLKVSELPTSEQTIVLNSDCKEDSELKKQVNELLAIDKAISDHEKC